MTDNEQQDTKKVALTAVRIPLLIVAALVVILVIGIVVI